MHDRRIGSRLPQFENLQLLSPMHETVGQRVDITPMESGRYDQPQPGENDRACEH